MPVLDDPKPAAASVEEPDFDRRQDHDVATTAAPLLDSLPLPRWLLVGWVIGGSAFALIVGKKQELPGVVTPLAAVLVVAVMGLWFGTRFWQALVVLFMVRTALDAFKVTSGINGLDPGSAIGALFVAAAIMWLIAQHRAGTLQRVSRAVTSISVLALAVLISAPGSRDLAVSLPSALKLVSVALMAIVLDQVLRQHPDRIRTLISAMLLSLVVPVVCSASQAVFGLPVENIYAGFGRARGTFTHPNPFATYLVTMLLMALALVPGAVARARELRVYGELIALFASLVGAAGSLYLTYARGAWIAFAVGVAVLGLLINRWIFVAMVAGVIIVITLVPSTLDRFSDLSKTTTSTTQGDPNSFAWRVKYWGQILPYWETSPVTGIGPEMTRNTAPSGFDPHNSFLQSLIELGVVGAAAFVATIVTVASGIRRSLKAYPRAGPERSIAVAAAATAAAIFVQLPTENILMSAVNWWYILPLIMWTCAASDPRPVPVDGNARVAHLAATAADS